MGKFKLKKPKDALKSEVAKHRAAPEMKDGRDVLECLQIIMGFQTAEKLKAKLDSMRAADEGSLENGTASVFRQLCTLMIMQGAPINIIEEQFTAGMQDAFALLREIHNIPDDVGDDECWIPQPGKN